MTNDDKKHPDYYKISPLIAASNHLIATDEVICRYPQYARRLTIEWYQLHLSSLCCHIFTISLYNSKQSDDFKAPTARYQHNLILKMTREKQ